MKIATANQSKQIDQITIEEIGIPGIVLMEHAGKQTVLEIQKIFPDIQTLKVLIIAGKGNNGGDGFVVARHLWNLGADVRIHLIGRTSEIKGDAATNAHIINSLGLNIHETITDSDLEELKHDIKHSDVIVDALLGTGLTKPLAGKFALITELVNESDKFVVSVDIPSGLSADSLSLIGPTIKANLTVTFGLPKPALIFYPTAEFAGDVIVADISIPSFAIEQVNVKGEINTPFHFHSIFMPRPKNSHKGSFGHLAVIAGSPGKTGAAVLSSEAASKIGTGLVSAAIPSQLNTILEVKLTEVMSYPVKGKTNQFFNVESIDEILTFLQGKTAVVIGPGISTDPETKKFLEVLIPQITVPMVIDADGLNNLVDSPILDYLSSKTHSSIILTPHPGEMARLLKLSTQEVLKNRIRLVTDFSQRYNVYIVFKTARTLMAFPNGNWVVNLTGNPGLATGGSGDVLSGMIGGYLAQGYSPIESTLAAVFLHGLASDIGVQDLGEACFNAQNILDFLNEAIYLTIDNENIFAGYNIPENGLISFIGEEISP